MCSVQTFSRDTKKAWRGKTPYSNKALEKELLSDEKKCAEHVMLVDLGLAA